MENSTTHSQHAIKLSHRKREKTPTKPKTTENPNIKETSII